MEYMCPAGYLSGRVLDVLVLSACLGIAMIYIILGMHKSGTTLVARALHESGVTMGQEFPTGMEYAKNKYEAGWVQEINDSMLGRDRQYLSLLVTPRLLRHYRLDDETRNRMRQGIAAMQRKYPDWGFKDPRSVITYKYWKDVLPEHKLIVVYRDPLQVWKRYSGFKRSHRFYLPFRTWSEYNAQILHDLRDMPSDHVIFLNFENLLADAGDWDKLQSFAGRSLLDVRDPGQSVNRLLADERQSIPNKLLLALFGREAERIYAQLEERRL